ncbi:MAG: TetR/AcrR family transcriptional regulator [Desulfobacteraceae bacterium]|nr:TetR/AcrR family transcriptional regulator [Desulfobacteraceae bacterium]MCF8037569.1 TetR/AcrR family transcriptional regulator [Desulfobacteraceae bacterium]
MTTKVKQNRIDRNERRDAVLNTALEAFSTNGFDKTTISQIASASNVPEATIYEYFQNKEDILFSLADQFTQALRRDLKVHFLGVEGVINRFRKFLWHHLYAFQENPAYSRLFSLELLNNPRYRNSPACRSLLAYRDELLEIIKEGIRSGVFTPRLRPELAEIMVFGTMHHMILSKVVLEKPLELVSRAGRLYELFMGALFAENYPQKEVIRVENGRRRDILTAALYEFYESGFQQATISKIAKRAGVTEPTIYEHFKNKQDLLYAIPEAAMKGYLVESVDADLANQDTPVHRLRTFLLHQIRSARDFPAYYYLLTTELRSNMRFYRSPHYHSLREYSARLAGILKEGASQGYFRRDLDLEAARDLYFGTLDELTLSVVIVGGFDRITAYAEEVFDMILHAISPPEIME